MRVSELMVQMAIRMCVIATVAFLFTRWRPFRRLVVSCADRREKVALTVIFGALGIMGTYSGVPVLGAIANHRVVAAAVAGLLGGPWVGLGAGAIAGLHRYALGGFTCLACGGATTVEGLLAGLVRAWIDRQQGSLRLRPWMGWLVGLVGESLHMGMVVVFSRPLPEAVALVRVIAAPMILVNSLGVVIFLTMLEGVRAEEDRARAGQTHRVLEVAGLTLPYLRRGLDRASAGAVAALIVEHTGASAVEIGRDGEVLGTAGAVPPGVRPARAELHCGTERVGWVHLYGALPGEPGSTEVALVRGLATLFSVQLELGHLERRAALATRDRLRALRAQVNPHFLFNALNTVVHYCRADPEAARCLLLDIAAFLRRTLSEEADLVPLARELEYMDAFLAIERARFGNGLRVVKRVAPEVLAVPVPSFSVQPLVDNALQHGLWPRGGRGTIWIEGERVGGRLRLSVRDDGIGIPGSPEAGNGEHCGLGLRNLRERLAACYGTDFLFDVRSRPGKGTAVTMVIPLSAAPGKWEDGLLQAAGGGG
ncbi:MAG: LytS/YhcK type 5TM receptor domain-containing protein [Bacillota bacterium]|nr:LytS/YhcK type 5TM receptor domain-containing protein [Bacillota bacterium]